MARSFSELAEYYAGLHGGRAAWFIPARNVPDALLKLGLIGPADRLVVCADDFAPTFRRDFGNHDLVFIDAPTPEGFLAASGASPCDSDASAASEEAPAHHASYAHAAGACVSRVFWFVNSIGCRGLRVPDIRVLVRAARTAGAILIVDDTVASAFCCRPLALGAHVVLESLDRVAGGKLDGDRVVALAVARSVTGHGRRQVTDHIAEEAYLLLSMRLGCGGPSSTILSEAQLAAIDEGLATLDDRMQRHVDHARALAEYLACHPSIESVAYPGLKQHPDHEVAARVLEHGFGPAIDFELPAPVTAASFIAVCDPAFLARPAGGVATRLSARDGGEGRAVRLFAGLDDPLATADRLEQALRMLAGTRL